MDFSAVISAAVDFLIVAAVVYFVVVFPLNTLEERRKRGVEASTAEPIDVELLIEVRDLCKGSGAPGRDRSRPIRSRRAGAPRSDRRAVGGAVLSLPHRIRHRGHEGMSVPTRTRGAGSLLPVVVGRPVRQRLLVASARVGIVAVVTLVACGGPEHVTEHLVEPARSIPPRSTPRRSICTRSSSSRPR